MPWTVALIAAARDYLAAARTALAEASGPEDLDHRLDAAFPDYGGSVFHPVQNFYLFQPATPSLTTTNR